MNTIYSRWLLVIMVFYKGFGMNDFRSLLRVVGKKFNIVGGYIAYGTDITNRENGFISATEVEGSKILELLPAINEIGVANIDEFILTGPSGLAGQVTANNHTYSSPGLNDHTLRSRYLDTTSGHLKIGSDVFLLNLSGTSIGVTSRNNIPIKYITQSCDRLEYYKGKIIIYKMDYVPLSSIANEGLEHMYYSEYSRNFVDRVGDKKIRDTSSEILEAAGLVYNKAVNANRDISCGNMIRIISMVILDDKDVQMIRDDLTLYIEGIDVCMFRWGLTDVAVHPMASMDVFSLTEQISMLEKHSSSIYLVDNRSNLRPLFTYMNGTVIEIPVIKDSLNREGLYININKDMVRGYISYINGDTSPFTPIDEIDNLPFIYKTIEEAKAGANRNSIFEAEQKEREGELRLKLTQLKNQGLDDESKINALKKEIEMLKMDAQRRSIEREDILEVKKEQRDDKTFERSEVERYTAAQREQDKMQLEMMKQILNESAEREKRSVIIAQENQKWERETTKTNGEAVMTTLKVVGSVVALGLAGYAIIKKL